MVYEGDFVPGLQRLLPEVIPDSGWSTYLPQVRIFAKFFPRDVFSVSGTLDVKLVF